MTNVIELAKTPKGKTILAVLKPHSGLYHFSLREGGILPQELEGQFTDVASMQIKINAFLSKKEEEMTEEERKIFAAKVPSNGSMKLLEEVRKSEELDAKIASGEIVPKVETRGRKKVSASDLRLSKGIEVVTLNEND